jgi:hypothetical protein
MKYIMRLSCDDLDDAINSLACFYGVEKARVDFLFSEGWPEFLSEDMQHSDFHSNIDMLFLAMAEHLEVEEPARKFTYVSYCHRGRFDGSSQWYEDGLLASLDGAKSFQLSCLNLFLLIQGMAVLLKKKIYFGSTPYEIN